MTCFTDFTYSPFKKTLLGKGMMFVSLSSDFCIGYYTDSQSKTLLMAAFIHETDSSWEMTISNARVKRYLADGKTGAKLSTTKIRIKDPLPPNKMNILKAFTHRGTTHTCSLLSTDL